MGKELGWHHLAMYSWSSQEALLPSAFFAAPAVLSAAGCQEGGHAFPVCSQNYVWQLLFLAKISGMNFVRFISGMNFVRFESVATPV